MKFVFTVVWAIAFWLAVYYYAKAAARSVFEKEIEKFKHENDVRWAKALAGTLEHIEILRKEYIDTEVKKSEERLAANITKLGDQVIKSFERVQRDVAYLDEGLGDSQDQIADLQDFLEVDYETTPETTKLVKVSKKK